MNKAFCTGIRERTISILSGIKAGTFERDEAIALSLLSAMAGESIFLLGLPGVGKSMIARRLKLAFKDASVFEYLMSRFSTPDEIFGPILRGRDIRRYSYDWAGLYLIATFPSRHYDIEEYPAVKQYLLSFGKERLEQTGREYVLNGQRIKSRKKTNNKWFETQDSIGYWEDFFKPKIIWKVIGSNIAFAIDNQKFIVNNACYLMTGENIRAMLPFLNSRVLNWYSDITNMNPTGVGDAQIGAQNIIKFPIPPISNIDYDVFSDNEIESLVCNIFHLTDEEREYIFSIYPISSLSKL